MSNQPIGVFDSGIGGTSILREVVKLLPNEKFIYIADSANAPYGEKSPEEILTLSKKNVEFLLEKDCKLIIVACNTATTNAIKQLRAQYPISFIGIEPAIKPAALHSKTNTIGILATKGTLSSKLFSEKVDLLTGKTKVIEVVGKGLVEHIESGDLQSEKLLNLLKEYVEPMLDNKIDYLVLGCSHYPYLIPILKKIVPKEVKIIDSGEAVARQTKFILEKEGILNGHLRKEGIIFYTSGKKYILEIICKKYFTNFIVKVYN